MQIILHLGAHRTASTHLQMTLARHRGMLAGRGVALFLPRDLRRDGLRLQDLLGLDPGAPEEAAHAAAIRTALGEAAQGATRLVVSEENIPGALYGQALFREGRFYARAAGRLARVAALLPAGEVTVALALRDPARFLASVHSQWLIGGRVVPFDRFVRNSDPASLRWSDLVARLTTALPLANVVLWRFEDYPEVAPMVLRAMLDEATSGVRLDPARSNAGLSARAQVEAVSAEVELAALGVEAARARVAALRAAYPAGADFPPAQPFDTGMLTRSAVAYARDLERIAAMPRVRLLRP